MSAMAAELGELELTLRREWEEGNRGGDGMFRAKSKLVELMGEVERLRSAYL